MAFVITRKRREESAPPQPELPRMIVTGEIDRRAIQFPDDVAVLRGICRGFGWDVDDYSLATIWRRVSLEHPLAKQFKSCDPWFTVGNMYSLFTKERLETLLKPVQ